MGLPGEPSGGEHPNDGGSDPPEEVVDELGWLAQPASELFDHRRRGEFKTRYDATAWRQIAAEFAYLILILGLCAVALIWIGYVVGATSPEDRREFWIIAYPRDRSFLLGLTVALSGIVGGTAFSLKWLYHSVAKWAWNTDRVFWRLIVPFLSGILAFFVAAMITAGIVSVFNADFFSNFYGALGGGFFIGYFSDNVLAALQNLAVKWFGTVDKRYQRFAHVHEHHDNGADPHAMPQTHFGAEVAAPDGFSCFARYRIQDETPWKKLSNVRDFWIGSEPPKHRLFFASADQITCQSSFPVRYSDTPTTGYVTPACSS